MKEIKKTAILGTEDLIGHEIKELQKTAILGTADILGHEIKEIQNNHIGHCRHTRTRN